ncbi:MAG: tetratricopeptide repeat protein [Candidatus Melainabacteria bacterium]|nr:tetratricopeptide repeat protein [Candidatus Melainabacteria bacterium]
MNQNDKGDDVNKKDGLDSQLESSFQSSFRSTSQHLKIYEKEKAGEAGAPEAFEGPGDRGGQNSSGVSGGASDTSRDKQNLPKQIVRDGSGYLDMEPPAGRHAPHHSWLLGSHGGKKKPRAVHERDGLVPPSAVEARAFSTSATGSVPVQSQGGNDLSGASSGRGEGSGGAGDASGGAEASGDKAVEANTDTKDARSASGSVKSSTEAPAEQYGGLPGMAPGVTTPLNFSAAFGSTPEAEAMLSGSIAPFDHTSAPGASGPEQVSGFLPEASIAPTSGPSPAPGSFAARIGDHPDDYRMPVNAKGALPPESYEEPDLYAATVEVTNPVAQGGTNSGASSLQPLDEPFDETVAHLYSQTVDVNKPGRLTRFPDDTLQPQFDGPESAAPKLGLTVPPQNSAPQNSAVQNSTPQNSPGGATAASAQSAVSNEPFRPGQAPPLPPGSVPPKLPPARPLSQFSSATSHPVAPPRLPPNLPADSTASQLLSSPSNPASPAMAPGRESKGWPAYETKPPQAGEATSARASGSFTPVQRAPASSSQDPPSDVVNSHSSIPADMRHGSVKGRKQAPERQAPDQDSAGTVGDGAQGKQKKRRLSSYIDRQIGNIDDQQSSDDDEEAEPIKKKPGSSGKKIALTLAAVVGLSIIGAVAYEGITSGGSNWIPLAGSGEWKELHAKAEEAIKGGRHNEAITHLTHAIKSNGNQTVLYHRRGLAKLQLHSPDQNESALRDLDLAVKKDPRLLEALLDRAAARIELKQFEQATEDYDKLLRLGKDTDNVHYGRGLAKYYSGEFAEAESEFRNVLKLNPDHAEAAIALGTSLYKSKSDKVAAEEQFTSAAKTDKSGLANRNLGILSFENGPGGYQTAKKFYNDAIDDNQNDAKLFNERGVISWSLKNPLDATTDFRHAIGKDPSLDAAIQNLGFVGKSLLDVNPKSEVALISLIELNLLKKNWSDAASVADKLIAISGWKNSSAYEGVLLKWVALNLGDQSSKAQETLRDCKMNAGAFPWPMPVVRYMADGEKSDFTKLESEAGTLAQRTSAHYFAGMKDYFDHKPKDAKKKLEWVIEQGAPSNVEYPLAGEALQIIAKETVGDSEITQ